MVTNDNELAWHQLCSGFAIHIQGQTFIVDLHVLPLCGSDLVLGVQWLKSLGPVLTYYNDLTLKFIHDLKIIELKGNLDNDLHAITPAQLCRMVQTNNASAFFHICVLDPDLPTTKPETTQYPEIANLLNRFSALFQTPTTLPHSHTTNHAIHLLPNSEPINVHPYCYPYFRKQEIETQVESMLQSGIICPNTSHFSSPVILVKKCDGSWSFCVDYRALNAVTIKDRFPIPTTDELLDELGGTFWFSKLDLLQGYHQILMKAEDVCKTTFHTHHGHYELCVMSFGLCNAPSSFQATMNSIFGPYLCRFIIVFFDDILIYSKTFTDHLDHLTKAFRVLLEGRFFLKLTKCTFAQLQVKYPGHIISRHGVELVPTKV